MTLIDCIVDPEITYLFLADVILFLHVLFVVFFIVGLLLIIIGKIVGWQWVRNPWFRLVHLLGIAFVMLEAWLGVDCPFTTWEMALRERAGDVVYTGSFISYWLTTLLYYHAPKWVFDVVYTVFSVLVVISWFWVRPHRFRADNREQTTV